MRGRAHSREFKLEVLRQVADGERRPAQVCREYGLAPSLLSRWRKEQAERGERAFGGGEPDVAAALERRVAELERLCGQLTLENTVLKGGLQTLRRKPSTP